MNPHKFLRLVFALTLNIPLIAGAQTANTIHAKAQGDKVLPLDPAVRTGKLANGFTYFIRHNTEPKNRVTFYLANKAGSILETDDQQGLAHFMEHMSFNGTKHFPKNELVNYLQKSGIQFGADLNAYTSFDETVYQLPLPTDNPEILKNGIQIMRDWAQDATLDPTEINKERGVVLEEKRLGKGAGERLRQQYFPLVLNNSRYASRLPIGTDEVLNNFKPETIKSFYHDWYRPDLQALIVVGDIDVNQMEQIIKTKFADLKNPVNEKARIKYTIPLTGKNQLITLTDKELTSTTAEVLIKQKGKITKTVADYRDDIIVALFNTMLKRRYAELSRLANPPFQNSSASISGFMGGLDTYSASVTARPGELKKGFKAMWRETERAKRFGFTQTELDRVKKSYLSSMEIEYKEKDKTNSNSYVNEYLQYFLQSAAAPGIEIVNTIVKKDMPGISLQDLNKLAKSYITETNRDIVVLAPDKQKSELPDEHTIVGWIKDVQQEQLKPYVDEISTKPLLISQPVPGKIISEEKNAKLNVITYKLSNGIKVLVKPTNYKNDEISFSGFSAGGTSLYPDNDYQSATNAASLIRAGGLGNYNITELGNFLSDKQASVTSYINERNQGVSGASTIKDLEIAMQMVYGYFTEPKKDSVVFQGIISRSKAGLANRGNDPGTVFNDTVKAVLSNYNMRRTGPSIEKLNQISLEKAFAIYKERFADASGFTFTFVGSIDTAKLKPLLVKYLAALPATHKNEEAKDLGIKIPAGKITKTVYKGSEPKATVDLVLSGDFDYNQQDVIKMSALKECLEIRLLERLREDESGVYTPSVSFGASKYPSQRFSFLISFGCSPQNVEKLIASALDEVKKLKEVGPAQVNIDKFKAEDERSREVASKTNGYWLGYLNGQLQNNLDLEEIFNYPAEMSKINPENLKQTAQKYLSGENYIRLVLLPETSK